MLIAGLGQRVERRGQGDADEGRQVGLVVEGLDSRAALQVAERAPGGEVLAAQAKQAWVGGQADAMLVAAVLLFIGAVVVAVLGPRTAPLEDAPPDHNTVRTLSAQAAGAD